MQNKTKYIVTLVSAVSLGGVAFTAGYEGFTSKPVIPTKGDVPTIGHGTTVYPNGQKVKMTDKAITKQEAAYFLKDHMNKNQKGFNQSLSGVKLSEQEYDLYNDFVYQFGLASWKNSSMLKNLKAGQYVAACKSLLKWKYVAKRDCSVRSNNCYGVWTRQLDRYNKCIGVN
ncbi:lysozyme [Acinetobacter puyangensis]|uniref:Lysozyme n=1 Tax=Acinetobacter puyangensis TaxID=1096779 RepID=A0A240E669_9GAMM|nr:glycoside hydrolase family protein [Acinetobacter puyangensis]SNX44258.1 Phage-related lysozyme (muramidase), GH24 family [Acinetobacter puyangensis]